MTENVKVALEGYGRLVVKATRTGDDGVLYVVAAKPDRPRGRPRGRSTRSAISQRVRRAGEMLQVRNPDELGYMRRLAEASPGMDAKALAEEFTARRGFIERVDPDIITEEID